LKFGVEIVKIETFNLNENLLLYHNYNGLDDLGMGSFEDTRLVVSSNPTFSAPFGFEKIIILCILDL
jgi:hypothetical protein